MKHLKYLLLISYFLNSTIAFSCGALNGKGIECDLISEKHNTNNLLIDDKIFFYFRDKEVYQVYLATESTPLKLVEINFGLYNLSSDSMTWNNNQYLLNRKNFELKIIYNKEYYFSCILLGRPLDNISKHFRAKINK